MDTNMFISTNTAFYVQAIVVAFAIYVTYKTLERIYWHPLSKYPGPFLAKCTDWYAAYYAFRGDLAIKMKEVHDQYGPFVRFGPSRLMVNTNTALQTIYKARNTTKSQVYRTTLASDGAWHVFNAIDKKMHARKNRIMRQAITMENLERFEPLWIQHAERFIDRLCGVDNVEDWTPARNVSYFANCMTMDVMGTVAFGKELELQSSPENRYMIDVIAKLQRWNSTHIQSLSLAKLQLDKLFYPQQVYYGWKLLNQVNLFVESRLGGLQEQKNNIFSFIVDAEDPETGERMPVTELWSEAKLLMVATADQIATTLSILLFYLTRYPDSYSRLREEIFTHFKEKSEIRSGSAMDQCVFLDACIREGLRMSPPTGGAPWREITHSYLVIDDELVPSGLDVGTSIYAIHHNEEYYPDSYTFRPERWLGEVPEQDLEVAESAYCPFLLGTRGCLGKTLALMEVKDFLVLLIWSLDIRATKDPQLVRVGEGDPNRTDGRHRTHEFQLRDHITSQVDGPYVEFRRRGEALAM